MAASALLIAASCSGVGIHTRNAATTLTLATTAPVATAGSALILCQIPFMAPLPWSRLYSRRARTEDADTRLSDPDSGGPSGPAIIDAALFGISGAVVILVMGRKEVDHARWPRWQLMDAEPPGWTAPVANVLSSSR